MLNFTSVNGFSLHLALAMVVISQGRHCSMDAYVQKPNV